MAHKSLSLKLRARLAQQNVDIDASKKLNFKQKLNSADNLLHLMSNSDGKVTDDDLNFINAEMSDDMIHFIH
jgi:hypothetical protein